MNEQGLAIRLGDPLDAAPLRPAALELDAAARPEMNRQERVIFTVYVVLGILTVLFLAATGVLSWLGA
jgi:hypothetical protein